MSNGDNGVNDPSCTEFAPPKNDVEEPNVASEYVASGSMDERVALTPLVQATTSMNRQLAESALPYVSVVENLNNRLATSLIPYVGLVESINKRLTTSLIPYVGLVESINKRLATSLIPYMSVMESVNKRLMTAAVPHLSIMASLAKQSSKTYLTGTHSSRSVIRIRPKHTYDVFPRADIVVPPHEEEPWINLFDSMVTDEGLRQVCRSLFVDGYYDIAVERAYVYVNNMVQARAGLTDKNGADLMRTAFSANSPVLKLNAFQTESEKTEQRGYMDLFAGSMTGIRNPIAHEHELVDDPVVALEQLVWANHLMRKLESATKD